MGARSLFTVLAAALFWGHFSNGDDFLKAKPADLQTCERKMPDFNKCFAQALQNIYTKWQNGVAGVEKVATIDPLWVEKFEVAEERSGAAPLVAKLTNITVTGLSQVMVTNVSVNSKNYNFKMTFKAPLVRLDGHYGAKAQVLLLNLDAKGKMFMEISDGVYSIAAKVRLREQDKWKFFDLQSLHFKVNQVNHVRFYFDNLFEDKALNDNTNAVFNDSWRELFDTYKAEVEKKINDVYFKHFGYVFSSVPAKFFIADVESDNSQ